MNGLPLRRPLTRRVHALLPGRRSAAPFNRQRCRLVLESLEGRWVPSTVTNLNDAGAGSLRQAILDTPAGGTVVFQQGLTGTITLTSGELLINQDLTIAGPGADVITVSGNQASRVFDIAGPSTVDISGLTITNGFAPGTNPVGGGVSNAGTLMLNAVVVSGNQVSASINTGEGGGIYNGGTLTITSSTVSGSSVTYQGGGIYNGGTLTITSSTLNDNQAPGVGPMGFGEGGGIFNNGTLSITSSTLSGSSAKNEGGGIENRGTLTVTSSTLSGNRMTNSGVGGGIDNPFPGDTLTVTSSTFSGNSAGEGGGIYSSGTLTVTSSSFSGNTAGNTGGGIENGDMTGDMLTIDSSTFSGNSAVGGGGGIDNNGGMLTISSSTISGNTVSRVGSTGGGIRNTGNGSMLTITSSTVNGNSAGYQGGGIFNDYLTRGVIAARNTLLAGNTASSGPDLYGTVTSQGHNLIGDGMGGSGVDPTDLVGTPDNPIDPRLGPLQDNGGLTQTMALLPGSPAIDAGDNTNAPMWDQRGAPFRRIVKGTIDIGAFEVQARGHGRPTGQPLPNPVPVQVLGTPGGSPLEQPPDLPADPSSLPGTEVADGQADLPGSEPSLARTADGQAVDAVLAAAVDQVPAGASVGPWPDSDLAPLAMNLLGGP